MEISKLENNALSASNTFSQEIVRKSKLNEIPKLKGDNMDDNEDFLKLKTAKYELERKTVQTG